MSWFIETKVKLSDGKTVKAYYLSEQGLKEINRIDQNGITAAKGSYVNYVREKLDEEIKALWELFSVRINKIIHKAFLQAFVKMDATKSVRAGNIAYQVRKVAGLPHTWHTYIFLEKWVNENHDLYFDNRGSGWYRPIEKVQIETKAL